MRDGVLGRLVGLLGVDRLGAGLDTGLGVGFGADRVGLVGRGAARDERELLDEDAGGDAGRDGRLTGAATGADGLETVGRDTVGLEGVGRLIGRGADLVTGTGRVSGADLVTGAGTEIRGVTLGKRGVALPSRGTPDPEDTRARSSRFRMVRPITS